MIKRYPGTLASLWTQVIRRPTRANLESFRNERITHLVHYAYHNVPYYRSLFDEHGFNADQFRGIEDLHQIPITTRETLQALPRDQIVSRGINPSHLLENWSSGSSGRKLCVQRSWQETATLHLIFEQALYSLGRKKRDRILMLDLRFRNKTPDLSFLFRLLDSIGMRKYRTENCLAKPEQLIRTLRKHRPNIIGGFSGIMARIGQSAGKGGLIDLGIRFIFTFGEVLTSHMRQQIQEAFDAPVYNFYAAIEFYPIAIECSMSGQLHVCDNSVALEVVRGQEAVGCGERGEVVATALHSYAMPLIRYRLGDIVTRGQKSCACGEPFSTISDIHGRMIDYFTLPDGSLIHPFEITTPMVETHSWIGQYQLTQEKSDHVVLYIVPRQAPSLEQLWALRHHCERHLGPSVHFDLIQQDEIRQEQSGKFRVSRSLISSEYDHIDWSQLQ